jgi:hypothetical protein
MPSEITQTVNDSIVFCVTQNTTEYPCPCVMFSTFYDAIKTAILSESAEWTLYGLKISSFPLNKEVEPSFFSDVGFDPDDLKGATVSSDHFREENGRRVEVKFYSSTNFGDKTPLEFFQQICLELELYISDAKTYSESTVIGLKKKVN